VIPLNSPQKLTSRAFWYVGLRTLFVALLALGLGSLVELGANSPHASCRGALCGTISGSHLAGFIYLFAAILAIRALINFRSLSFVLTDKSISISSGVLFRNSSTIRFDRIQDVRVLRDPLHLVLGLSSVAIWTASPDQRVGNTKRPDGLLVLEVDEAEWLKDYLSDPGGGQPAATAPGRDPGVAVRQSPASLGVMPFAVVGAIVALAAAAALWHHGSHSASPAALPTAKDTQSAPASADTSAANAPAVQARTERVPARAAPDPQFALVCAIRPQASSGMTACAELGEARRCTQERTYPSQPTQQSALFTVANRSDETVKFFWLDGSGARALYASVPPGGRVDQQTRVGAHWLVATEDGRCVGIFNAATMAIGIY
jgi:membrane protein YdbS with pleckstrin-like domain